MTMYSICFFHTWGLREKTDPARPDVQTELVVTGSSSLHPRNRRYLLSKKCWSFAPTLIPTDVCHEAFLPTAAALAFAAFFLLLLIITMPRNDPTTAEPSRVRMTGIRIAQTRGGKRLWSG